MCFDRVPPPCFCVGSYSFTQEGLGRNTPWGLITSPAPDMA